MFLGYLPLPINRPETLPVTAPAPLETTPPIVLATELTLWP